MTRAAHEDTLICSHWLISLFQPPLYIFYTGLMIEYSYADIYFFG